MFPTPQSICARSVATRASASARASATATARARARACLCLRVGRTATSCAQSLQYVDTAAVAQPQSVALRPGVSDVLLLPLLLLGQACFDACRAVPPCPPRLRFVPRRDSTAILESD